MTRIPKYYSNNEDFQKFYVKLKSTPCPHCKRMSALILHGFLYGYDEASDCHKVKRGRRIFCSNRNSRNGCGRTFSVLTSRFLKRFSITAKSLWKFLINIAAGKSIHLSFHATNSSFNASSAYRLFKRFLLSQSHIRTLLYKLCKPDNHINAADPWIETMMHLQMAFPNSACPVADFQESLQSNFI